MKNFKAVETEAYGYRFRSRLEARWSVFFTTLGVRWRYETEGYELSGCGRYLPDFYLPDWDVYFEVKPDLPYEWINDTNDMGVVTQGRKTTDLGKFLLASGGLQKIEPDGVVKPRLYMLCGTPWLPRLEKKGDRRILKDGAVALLSHMGYITLHLFAVDKNGEVDLWKLYEEGNVPFVEKPAPRQLTGMLFPTGSYPSIYMGTGRQYNHRKLLDAYSAARKARFEFGEAPR